MYMYVYVHIHVYTFIYIICYSRRVGGQRPIRSIRQGLDIVCMLSESRQAFLVHYIPKLDGRVGTTRHKRRLIACTSIVCISSDHYV